MLFALLRDARARGDRAAPSAAWARIVVAEIERVRGILRAFQHDALPGGRIPREQIDDVARDVFVQVHERSGTFSGHSVGELRAFMRTAAGLTARRSARRAPAPLRAARCRERRP